MNRWDNLSMKDKAKYIKLGVDSNITDLNTIRNIYNEYENGGFLSKIKDTSKEIVDKIKIIKNNFTLDKDIIMNRFYNHFDPYMTYSDEGIKRAMDLILGGPQYAKDNFPKEKNGFSVYYNEGAATPFDDAVWGTYLNIPVKDRKHKTSLEESEYKPSKGSSNTKYYKIPIDDETKKSIINTGSKLKIGENTLSKDLFVYNMGTSTVGRGIDKDKGEYISYYDKWDINPLHGDYVDNTIKEKYPILSRLVPSRGEDVFKGITSPISFYDRIYLDDYYGVKTNTLGGDTYFGGYLPEIIISNPFAEGGNMNKKSRFLGLTGAEKNNYNSYSNGGFVNSENSTDSWKPWYWFTPKYEGESLKNVLFKAYDDGLEGKDILYNGRAYKVKLSPEDYKKYINSGSNTIQTKRFERVLDNDSKTSLKSMEMENDINRRQQQLMDLAISKGHNSEDYYIPYIYDKEIKVKGIGRFSTNMLDSIAVNAKRANIPLSDAIGLAAEETKMGAIPNYSLEANKKRYKEKYGVEMPKDVQKELERTALNSSVARNFGGIQPQFLVNNHEWANRGWEDSSKYKYLAKIKSPLEHAFTLFKNGLYNTGDKNHTDKIKKKGKEIIATKEVQNWLKDYTK